MLFDLSSPGRKNVIRVVYAVLAALFLIGFVGFGIGGELGGGGIIDSITGGGDGDTAEEYEQQIEDAENRVEADPTNERALADLVQYRYLSGDSQLERDETTGQPTALTEESRSEFEETVAAWDRYVQTNPQRIDVTAGTYAVQAYVYLGDASGAAAAQKLVAEAQPNANAFFQLASYYYADGDFKNGDKAAEQAVAEAPANQRKQVEKALDQTREQAMKAQKQLEKNQDSDTGGSGIESPFGGLGPNSGVPPTAP
jgi:tetratricopeptide (TPR) repeat protein